MAITGQTYPLTRERNLILASLLVLAALAWAVLIWQADEVGHDNMAADGQSMMSEVHVLGGQAPQAEGAMDHDSHMGLRMDMSAALFLGLWAAMMVAIMFPTAAPMILNFARVQANRKQRGQLFVPVWLFVGSYIFLWSATGLLAYGAATGGDALADNWD